MLSKSKFSSMETLVSKTLIDLEISDAEFITILQEKDKYEKMKENVRNLREKLERKTPRKYETKQCEFKKNQFVNM